MRNFNSA